MQVDALKEYFDDSAINQVQFNPLQVAENQMFNRKTCQNYRKAAIDFVTKKMLWFLSTGNSQMELLERYVKVSCPYCKSNTEICGSGGGGGNYTTTYRCEKCKAEVSLTMQENGFCAMPNK